MGQAAWPRGCSQTMLQTFRITSERAFSPYLHVQFRVPLLISTSSGQNRLVLEGAVKPVLRKMTVISLFVLRGKQQGPHRSPAALVEATFLIKTTWHRSRGKAGRW